MGERVDAVDLAGVSLRGLPCDAFGGVIHAAHRIQHPQLVARAGPAIAAPVAFEGRDSGLGTRDSVKSANDRLPSSDFRLVPVVEQAGERGLEIVRMNPVPG